MKKGFTLIELMVVIVIMGVLAAVAVPKLFGLITKAKASELQPAAGTYVHLQEAHIVGNTTIGDWKQIGYAAPVNGNSKNFCYSQGDLKTSIDIASNGEGIIGWGATNKAILNECAANNWWSITINGTDKSSITFKQNVSETNCQTLLANWNVGQTLTGDCAAPEVAQRDPESQSGSTQPGTKPETEDPKQDSPTTPPSKSVNLDEYYSYANGEYQKCNPSGNDNVWLTGKGATCKQLKELLIENGDLVNEKNKKGEPIDNKYEFKDEDTECLVTRRCSENRPYEKVLEDRKNAAEEEAKKAAGEDNKQPTGGSGDNTGSGNDNSGTGDNSSDDSEDDDSDGSDETPDLVTDRDGNKCTKDKYNTSSNKCKNK